MATGDKGKIYKGRLLPESRMKDFVAPPSQSTKPSADGSSSKRQQAPHDGGERPLQTGAGRGGSPAGELSGDRSGGR